MVFRPRPDCEHADNYRRCRLHRSWLQRLFPTYRPACIIDKPLPPPDGEWECADQVPLPRQRPPRPGAMSAGVRPR